MYVNYESVIIERVYLIIRIRVMNYRVRNGDISSHRSLHLFAYNSYLSILKHPESNIIYLHRIQLLGTIVLTIIIFVGRKISK